MPSTETATDAQSASATTTADVPTNTKERMCKTVPEPPARRLDVADLFANPSDPGEKPDLEKLKQHILLEGRLTEAAAMRIIDSGKSYPSDSISRRAAVSSTNGWQ